MKFHSDSGQQTQLIEGGSWNFVNRKFLDVSQNNKKKNVQEKYIFLIINNIFLKIN